MTQGSTKNILAVVLILLAVSCRNSVRDYDGNIYEAVKIGNQSWLQQDLKTTHLNDGSAIPEVETYESWTSLTSPGYSWYNNDSSSGKVYGALYNWYAVNTGKLCPKGWHVSTETDWELLERTNGGSSMAGGRLKEQGADHWKGPNITSEVGSGFNSLPNGFRSFNGSYTYLGKMGYWWTSDGVMNERISVYKWNIKPTSWSTWLLRKTMDSQSGVSGTGKVRLSF